MTAPQAIREYLLGLQQRIVGALEQLDGGSFIRDGWTRAPGERLQGDGITRCIEGGALLERGGCNFSHVRGRSCRLRPRSTGPSWPARRSRPWACRWCSTHETRTCPRCT